MRTDAPGHADPVGFDPLEPPDDPWPHLAALRAECPVARFPERGVSLVLGYETARSALRDTETFSSRVRPREDPSEHTIQSTDPPDHTRLRKLVNRAFTIERVRTFEPRIRAIARGLVDALPDGEPLDLVERLTIPLPVTVIAELLGVEPSERAKFKRWSDDMVRSSQTRDPRESMAEFRAWARAQVRARREASEPPNDLLSDVALAEEDGRRLEENEAASMAMILVTAGNETTTNALGTAIAQLLAEPGLFERVRADRSLIADVIEETLRFDPPIPLLPRKARRATELGGEAVATGETLLVHLGGANRDPAVFDEPDRFDIGRRSGRTHIGFGYGAHTCVGAPLARAELTIGLEVLMNRFPRLRPAPGRDAPQIGYFLLRGPASLWVESGA